MSRRFQQNYEPVPGIQVTAWGAHRYEHSSKTSPAAVAIHSRRFSAEDNEVELSIDISVTVEQARLLATALTAAADAAGGAAVTDASTREPEVR